MYVYKYTYACPYLDTCDSSVLFCCCGSQPLDRTKAQHSNNRQIVSLCFDACVCRN